MASSFERFHEEIRPLAMLEEVARPEAEQVRDENAPAGRYAVITAIAVTLAALLLLGLL